MIARAYVRIALGVLQLALAASVVAAYFRFGMSGGVLALTAAVVSVSLYVFAARDDHSMEMGGKKLRMSDFQSKRIWLWREDSNLRPPD